VRPSVSNPCWPPLASYDEWLPSVARHSVVFWSTGSSPCLTLPLTDMEFRMDLDDWAQQRLEEAEAANRRAVRSLLDLAATLAGESGDPAESPLAACYLAAAARAASPPSRKPRRRR
jgi:hypothetical protein